MEKPVESHVLSWEVVEIVQGSAFPGYSLPTTIHCVPQPEFDHASALRITKARMGSGCDLGCAEAQQVPEMCSYPGPEEDALAKTQKIL